MTRYRNFSASTGLAALLAAGIIVLGSADVAWAKGGSGGGGGGHMSGGNSSSGNSSSQKKPAFINTIHPIISPVSYRIGAPARAPASWTFSSIRNCHDPCCSSSAIHRRPTRWSS